MPLKELIAINVLFFKEMHPHRKKQYIISAILSLFSAIFEIFSVAAVFPLLNLFISGEGLTLSKSSHFEFLDAFESPELFFSGLFVLCLLFTCLVRLFSIRYTSRFAFNVAADFENLIFERILHWPYDIHISKNSADFSSSITVKCNSIVFDLLIPSFNVINACFVLTVLVLPAVINWPFILIMLLIVFFLYFFIVSIFFGKIISANSFIVKRTTDSIFQLIGAAFGSIRDVIIFGSQNYYVSIFQKMNNNRRHSQATSIILAQVPRVMLEFIALSGVVLFTLYLYQRDGDISPWLPIIGVIAFALQKFLPTFQLAYSSLTQMRSALPLLNDVLSFVVSYEKPVTNSYVFSNVEFSRAITLEGVSFSYGNNNLVAVEDICLRIDKGTSVGFVGESGSGKSTCVDIIMGLLFPTDGTVSIDEHILTPEKLASWRGKISHVSQNVFLTDRSVIENIAIGVPFEKIDMDRVIRVAKIACADSFITNLEHSYETRLGERGINLSGGQRQRLAIARALYRSFDVLVLDEATSALDERTEQEVIRSIFESLPSVTVIMISHRHSTLQNCSIIHKLSNGKLVWSGQYHQLETIK